MEDYRRKLEQLNPNVTLSVELPHQGNGDLFQVRTTIADGLIFYGRATTEDEAILKCCQKAVKHLLKNNNNINVSETHSRRSSSSKQQSPARPPSRRNRETPRLSSHPRRGLSSREEELRNEMGSVLDRVAEWSRYYDHNGNSTNNNNYSNRRYSKFRQMATILQTVRNLHFLSKNSILISRENCRLFWGGKTRENVVVMGFLAVGNFDFTRKIVKKIWVKNS